MRMWGVHPMFLCRKHLLGEHVEMHMFAGTIKKGVSITGYISKGLVNPKLIKKRHNALAIEMLQRGYNHKSPLGLDCNPFASFPVDILANHVELMRRCPECAKRYKKL